MERFRNIIEDMLDVVRIESRSILGHKKPTVVQECIMTAVRQLEGAAQERQLTIDIGPMEGLPVVVADPERLGQVFFNLLSNAIKYTPDGGQIRIKGRVISAEELMSPLFGVDQRGPERLLHILFEDTGIGIAPEDQEQIFDLFYEVQDTSLHSTSKTRFLGSGLGIGLSVARGIVEAHGGYLWAESEGHDRERCPGSRFHVLLPAEG